ncbi:hypothetical protein [Fulvivirga ligni]|uniref:hypothetical protein n=1 Tax=Fulvivirga ligni TaxID=2904246 RepID=UPI001F28C966|nr:hypothetical protein [Fulvivirga ligni]UII24000.1 hypothetical protein LVD16_12300 [Fulvivirga ligni]
MLPPLFDSWISISLYLLLVFIIIQGIRQYLAKDEDSPERKRSLIPLGAIGVIFGAIGYAKVYRDAFDAIAAAGDISPTIVASALRNGASYPILGLLCLAVTFAFKYITPVK